MVVHCLRPNFTIDERRKNSRGNSCEGTQESIQDCKKGPEHEGKKEKERKEDLRT